MRTLLIVLTLIEVALLVAVLATYLVVIAAKLRKVSHTLGLVTFGVRAIERQTEPIGPVVGDINRNLEQVAAALESATAGAGAPGDADAAAAPGAGARPAPTQPPSGPP